MQKENTQWSAKVLEGLKKKSPVSLKLTLRLIREAASSEWAECYKREFRVACRRIQDAEFK